MKRKKKKKENIEYAIINLSTNQQTEQDLCTTFVPKQIGSPNGVGS